MKTYTLNAYPLTEFARLMSLTPKSAREAAERGLIPGAFRPYAGGHWKISGAALNDVVARLKAGTTVAAQEKSEGKKRRRKNERAAIESMHAAV